MLLILISFSFWDSFPVNFKVKLPMKAMTRNIFVKLLNLCKPSRVTDSLLKSSFDCISNNAIVIDSSSSLMTSHESMESIIVGQLKSR